MSCKVFVGGLAWSTNDDSLRDAFSRFGSVQEAKVISDRETGRSRGFGFVTFGDREDAQRAISEMNEKELDGRVIKVNEAEDRPRTNNRERGGHGGGHGGGGGGGGGGRGNRW